MGKILKLKDVCDIKGGYAFKSGQYKTEGTLLVRIGDISNRQIEISDKSIYVDYDDKYSKYILNKGDILIALSGATTGKFGIYGYDKPALLNQRVAKLSPNELIDNRYLFYYMNRLQDIIYSKAFGCAQPNISTNEIGEISIYVPSLSVQEKIVELLDIASSLVDKRKEQIDLLDELLKAEFLKMFGNPISNPMNWNKNKLKKECKIITGNTPPRKIKEYYGDYIEWIKSDNITDDAVYLGQAKEYLSEKGLAVGRSVDKNSILMTCIAGSLKCIGTVAIADRKVTFNQQINAIEPLDNNVYFMYMQFNLSKQYIQSTINMALKGILSKGQLSEMEFIFPPVELQNKFGEYFKVVESVRVNMEKSLHELENNFDALMQKAFSGKLFVEEGN